MAQLVPKPKASVRDISTPIASLMESSGHSCSERAMMDTSKACMRVPSSQKAISSALLALLALASHDYLCAQIATAQQYIRTSEIGMTTQLVLKDLTDGYRELRSIRDRTGTCREQRSFDDFCLGPTPLPETLRKTAPYVTSGSIAAVGAPPYQPYSLTRVQSQLTFASFVPMEQVNGGAEAQKRWSQYADTGELIDCRDTDSLLDDPSQAIPPDVAILSGRPSIQASSIGFRPRLHAPRKALSCLAVVHNVQQEDDLRFLSICQVVVVDRFPGALTGCTPISASASSGQWLLAYTGSFRIVVADNGRPDFRFNVFYSPLSAVAGLATSGTLTASAVLSAAELSIHSSPLSLETVVNSHVLGTSPRRKSKVLSGAWNEEVTVRIDVNTEDARDTNGTVTARYFTLEVSTAVLVNQQKDSNHNHWHQPSPEQTQAWGSAIKVRLTEELRRLCAHASRRDDFTLACK